MFMSREYDEFICLWGLFCYKPPKHFPWKYFGMKKLVLGKGIEMRTKLQEDFKRWGTSDKEAQVSSSLPYPLLIRSGQGDPGP